MPGRGHRLCLGCARLWSGGYCRLCGDRAEAVSARGHCAECAALVHAAAVARRRARLAMKRKPCRNCGRPKGPGQKMYCSACAAKRSEPRRCGCGAPLEKLKRKCPVCCTQAALRSRAVREQAVSGERKDGGKRRRYGVIPARPLALAIDRAAAITQADRDRDDGCFSSLCEILGISERLVFRWRCGEAMTVSIDRADSVLFGLDWLWFDVWNEDTVRLPILVAQTFFVRSDGRRARRAIRAYGDAGPDLATLEAVRAVFDA